MNTTITRIETVWQARAARKQIQEAVDSAWELARDTGRAWILEGRPNVSVLAASIVAHDRALNQMLRNL